MRERLKKVNNLPESHPIGTRLSQNSSPNLPGSVSPLTPQAEVKIEDLMLIHENLGISSCPPLIKKQFDTKRSKMLSD